MNRGFLLSILVLLPILASADDSGTCGDGVTYTYVDETRTLTISKTGEGSGAMTDYEMGYDELEPYRPSIPWLGLRMQIREVVIEDGITHIGDLAFICCGKMTSLTIPNSVKSIGERSFEGCSSLTSVVIPNGVTSIGYATFYGCEQLVSVEIPEGVASIGDWAFSRCTSLTSVTIPSSVTSLGEGVFWDINFESVISMIEEPFTIKGESEEFSPFYHDTFQNAILYVPVGTVDMYKETKGWKEFVTIKEIGGTGIGHVEAQASDAPYYNLNGQRIAQPKKGIYIQNGKKTVIK